MRARWFHRQARLWFGCHRRQSQESTPRRALSQSALGASGCIGEVASFRDNGSITMGLNHIDLALIAVYLLGITLFGLRFRKRQRSLRDYFLADGQIPWWALALSIVAAETSTFTIISIPG